MNHLSCDLELGLHHLTLLHLTTCSRHIHVSQRVTVSILCVVFANIDLSVQNGGTQAQFSR